MPGLVVVNGAKITCNRLASCDQKPLTVAGGFLGPQAGGQPVATINDHLVGKNIEPFSETCQTTGKRCDPATPAPWSPGESAALIVSFVPIIAQSATLSCTTGCGVISIVNPGQTMFEVYPPAPSEDEDSGGFLEDAWDFLVADDARTLADSDAPWYERGLAGASLIPVPVGKLLKGAKVVRKAIKGRKARKGKKTIKAKNPPKSSPNFRPPTNPPQMPPKKVPDGWRVRHMRGTQDYPDGYWKLEKPMKQGGWQAVDPSTMKPGGRPQTHVPFPPHT